MTPADLNKVVSSRKQILSSIHLNGKSAHHNEESITALLTSCNFCFNVLMVTETWYGCDDEVLNVPWHVSYFLNRFDKRHGGIMLLANKTFQCELVHSFTRITTDFEVFTAKKWQGDFFCLVPPARAECE